MATTNHEATNRSVLDQGIAEGQTASSLNKKLVPAYVLDPSRRCLHVGTGSPIRRYNLGALALKRLIQAVVVVTGDGHALCTPRRPHTSVPWAFPGCGLCSRRMSMSSSLLRRKGTR